MYSNTDVVLDALSISKRYAHLVEVDQQTNPSPYTQLLRRKTSPRLLSSLQEQRDYERLQDIKRKMQMIKLEYCYQERSHYFISPSFSNRYLNQDAPKLAVKFIRKLNAKFKGKRHCLVWERGSKNNRLHFHMYLSLSSPASLKQINDLWDYGRCVTTDANDSGVIDYLLKTFKLMEKVEMPVKKRFTPSKGFGRLEIPPMPLSDLYKISRLLEGESGFYLLIREGAANEFQRRTGFLPGRIYNPGGLTPWDARSGKCSWNDIMFPKYGADSVWSSAALNFLNLWKMRDILSS